MVCPMNDLGLTKTTQDLTTSYSQGVQMVCPSFILKFIKITKDPPGTPEDCPLHDLRYQDHSFQILH